VVDLIVTNAFVMTMDNERRCYKNAAVVIEGGIIVAVGETQRLMKEYVAKDVIDASNMAVLPGFVNLHGHLSEKFIPGLSDDSDLYSWLSKLVYPVLLNSKPEECYWMALLGCIEMIKSGITCFVDTFGQLTEKRVLNRVAEAASNCGLRAYLSREVEEITDKSAQAAIDDTLLTAEELRSKNVDRVQVRMAPGIAITTSRDLLEKMRDIAHDAKLGMNMHFAETRGEILESKKRFGNTPIRYAYEIGLLGPEMIAAHCVWVDAEEIKLLRKTGTNVAYNPLSNMKLADGVAPICRMIDEGVNVGLGTDGAASNDNLDMFTCMKAGSYLQKVHNFNASLLPSHMMIGMVTLNGAKALGLEGQLGSIEPGMKADLILVDLTTPNIAPVHDVARQLVCSGSIENVDTVIVDGKLLMKHHQILCVDDAEAVARAYELSRELISRAKVKERLNGELPGVLDQ